MMMMSSASSSAASVAVDKATSDLLIGPDWTMNIDICDSVNSNNWQAKDVVKAVKRRLQHKSSKVQLLALTLLETLVKNCGEYVHLQIVERNILGEMVKIVKKKADMVVRDKILALLDSWQAAFGGPGGKHPQYYWAYDELRRSGVEFPKRSLDAAPIFTPPVSHPTLRPNYLGFGMPSNSSRRLDETMAIENESLSLSSLDSMKDVMELLTDMLQAINPDDRTSVKDEVIVDLVNRCRSNQKKLMQMLTTTGDEELLSRGLELNDGLQTILAKHDAIASGSPIPIRATSVSSKPAEESTSDKSNEVKKSLTPNISPPAPVAAAARSQIDEEEEEEDDFAQLARRHFRAQSSSSQSTSTGTSEGIIVPINSTTATATSSPCNALALPDPPTPVKTTKEQDLIDLLSITLSTTSSSSPHTPSAPPTMHQVPVTPSSQGYTYPSQSYTGSQGQLSYNSYVVPWAQTQPQVQQQYYSAPQVQSRSQPQINAQSHTQFHAESQAQQQSSSLSQAQPQFQVQSQSQHHPQSQLSQLQTPSQPQPQPQIQVQSQSHHHPQSQSSQLQTPSQPQPQFQVQSQSHHHPQSQSLQLQTQSQPQPQPQFQVQSQSHHHPQSHSSQLQTPSQHQPQFQVQSQSHHHPQPHLSQLQTPSQPQSQSQVQSQSQHHPQSQSSQLQTPSQPQPQFQAQLQTQPQLQAKSQTPSRSFAQPQHQPQFQPQYTQHSSVYPPPPWAATPGYFNGQNHLSYANNMYGTASNPAIGSRNLQQSNSFPARASNGAPMNGDSWASVGTRNAAPVAGQKPFIPSYRLFEDLNVLGNADGRLKMTSSNSPSLSSSTSSQSMVGGRK